MSGNRTSGKFHIGKLLFKVAQVGEDFGDFFRWDGHGLCLSYLGLSCSEMFWASFQLAAQLPKFLGILPGGPRAVKKLSGRRQFGRMLKQALPSESRAGAGAVRAAQIYR
jgi:hypothetical protein